MRPEALAVLRQFRVGLRRAAAVGHVQPRQRTDAVDAVRIADRLVVRRLQIRIRERRLADVIGVVAGRTWSASDAAVGVAEAQGRRTGAAPPSGSTRPPYIVGKLPKVAISPGNGRATLLKNASVRSHDRHRRRQLRPGCARARRVERRVDAAGDDPRGMDALLASPSMICWPNLRSAMPSAGVGMLLDQARRCCAGRIAVEAQQQVGRREVEEAQRVRLHELRAVEQLAQLRRGRRDAHGHDRVAGLGRRQQMADRADAADARGDRRHLVKRPAFGELLEAAHLGDVELRVGDLARVVEIDRDLGVAFDARTCGIVTVFMVGLLVHGVARFVAICRPTRTSLWSQFRHAALHQLSQHEQDRAASAGSREHADPP